MARQKSLHPLVGVIIVGMCCGAGKPSDLKAATAVQTVLDCRAITDVEKRLACFDGAAAGVADAEAKGDLITMDRAQRREARRQSFGSIRPAPTSSVPKDRGEDTENLTATVASAWQSLRGPWMIQLEGGALWRQTDDVDLLRLPHKGSVAVILRRPLGGFLMKIDGDAAFQARREN